MFVVLVVRPPLWVRAESTVPFTAKVTWQPVEDVLVYHCIIQNLDEPTSPPSVHNVTDTKLDVKGILPCSTYLISVSSFSAFLLLSEPTDFTYTTNSESAPRAKLISVTLWLGSRSAILSEALLSDVQNVILGVGERIQRPQQPTCYCRINTNLRETEIKRCFEVLLQCVNDEARDQRQYMCCLQPRQRESDTSEWSNVKSGSWKTTHNNKAWSNVTVIISIPSILHQSLLLYMVILRFLIQYAVLLAELPPVSSISVDYTCTNQSATVQWSVVSGATYKATAKSDNGTELTCTSQTTNCQITGLSCGQNYVVKVTPISENCENTMNSTSATFETGEITLSQRDTLVPCLALLKKVKEKT